MHPVSESVANVGPNALRMTEAAALLLPPSAWYSTRKVAGFDTMEAIVVAETTKDALEGGSEGAFAVGVVCVPVVLPVPQPASAEAESEAIVCRMKVLRLSRVINCFWSAMW